MPAVAIGTRIYVAGGLAADGSALATLEIYDVSTDQWTAGPAMPAARHHPGAAALGGKVYITGGYDAGAFPGSPTTTVFEFDPLGARWTARQPMPDERAAHVAVAFGGKMYVFGGVSGGGVVATGAVYDPVTDIWTSVRPMPTAREHLAAAVVGSRIMVVGGRRDGNNAELEAYDPSSDSWERLPSMPTARGGLAAAAARDKLYAFGGESPGVFPTNEEFDPSVGRWRSVAPLPTPRHGMGAVSVNDTVFVIGGGFREGFGASAVNEAFVAP